MKSNIVEQINSTKNHQTQKLSIKNQENHVTFTTKNRGKSGATGNGRRAIQDSTLTFPG